MKTGQRFEIECAALLELAGWSVELTKSSGDQGADIIAQWGNTSVAVQCKDYKSTVGNKGVQEAVSAKYFYKTDHAVVIGVSGFTSAAMSLANRAGVLLLAPPNLSRLHVELGLEKEPDSHELSAFSDLSKLKFVRTFSVASPAQAEIFRAASLVIGELNVANSVKGFLNSLDQETFLGSGKVKLLDLLIVLKIADMAFTTKVTLTEHNRDVIRAKSDPEVRKMAERKTKFEYWRLLGGRAVDVQEAFKSLISAFHRLLRNSSSTNSVTSSLLASELMHMEFEFLRREIRRKT